MGTKHEDKRDIKIMDRAQKVKKLRLANFTYAHIADVLNVSVETVRRDIERLKVDFPEQSVREMTVQQNERIETLMTTYYLKATKGDYKAADMVMKLMKHQADLFNLFDLPQDTGQKAAQDKLQELMHTIAEAATNKVTGE